MAKSRKSHKMGFTHVYDIHPFVVKPPPLIQRPSTVGGLDKRTADSYWKAYKPRVSDSKSFLGYSILANGFIMLNLTKHYFYSQRGREKKQNTYS